MMNILVTGASRGIGRAIACTMANADNHIIINYKNNVSAAEETRAMVQLKGANGSLVQFDVADRDAARTALHQYQLEYGNIQILIYNAGIKRDSLAGMMNYDDWDTVIQTNLNGFFYTLKPILRGMMQNAFGRIVIVSSVAAMKGIKGQMNYAASKAGLIGAAKSLAVELAEKNITVNVVAPGPVDTDMLASVDTHTMISRVPMGRLGTPEDVGVAVAFLCSEQAQFITGQVLGVNGGEY